MKLEKQEEEEMEKLLGEIPHATSPHPHVHANGVDPDIHDRHHHRSRGNHAHASISPPDGGGVGGGWSGDDEYLRLLATLRSLHLEPGEMAGGLHCGYDRRRDVLSGLVSPFGNVSDSYRVPRQSDPLFGNSNAGGYGGVHGLFEANSRTNAHAYFCGPYLQSGEPYLQSEQNAVGLTGAPLNAGISRQAMLSKLHYDSLASPLQHSWDPPVKNVSDFELFRSDDSFILQGERMYFGNSRRREPQRAQRDWRMLQCRTNPGLQSPSSMPPHHYNFVDDEKYIYYIAKDQHGCRYLQKKFDEGTRQEVDSIFNGIINHVVELMVNPFGNYLIQKLLDVCTEEQRMKIVLVLTKDPDELLTISLNIHGTRAVQKLIETLQTRQQVKLVVSALQPGFLALIKDLNGNHVVQRCLQSLSAEDNKFIFDAAAKYCIDIATHRHGCCVLQRCIEHSTGRYRENLLAEISSHGLLLAQDAFGNYVVQFILGLENPLATATLVSQFCGNYVNLSMQKFSSNVVEKCLKVISEKDRATIIFELLAAPRFDQLLQDPYANYVVQSALKNTKGSLHAELVEAIRPYAAILRTSPYCKRIFSGTLSKK